VRLRSTLLLAGLFAASLAAAQSTTHIEFESARHCIVFSSAKPPTSKPEDSQEITGTSADVPVPSSGTLYVWDRDSGNIASKPANQIGKKWYLTEKDFDRIGLVTVRVEYDGEPVAAARIVLRDKAREQSQILDEGANGEADFYVIQPGTETVTVEYRSGDSPAQPLIQQFPLDLARKTPDPLLKVVLASEAQTVNGNNPPPTNPAQTTSGVPPISPGAPVVHANPIGSFFVFIFTLAIAAGIAYGLYLLAKKYPLWLRAKLAKFGVDVPEIDNPEPDSAEKKPVAVVEPPKPKAPSKIILDDAQIGAAPMPTAAPATIREPRLVKGNGEFVTLMQGETVVGREDNLGVSLVGESSVSRRHAAVIRQGSEISVKDLGSTNGTFVNGRKISDVTSLRSGDEIQFGAIRFRLEGA